MQLSFSDLGTPLYETAFVICDIETTGGSPKSDTITEIGAIRTERGEVTGTFETLVRPAEKIAPYVELLTGITEEAVSTAPPIEAVLPSLWEFMRGAVFVGHNARFDSGFIASAFARHGYSLPFRKTICTLRMARWLMRGETTNLKLETLAHSIGTATKPCHRALPDAQATLEIFFRLLELAGPMGVVTLEDLQAFCRAGSKPRLGKLSIGARVPRAMGVYKFLDRNGRVIYVGKGKNLRARVRSYFYGDERQKITGLLEEAARVEVERTETEMEAELRELQLIRQHQPKYNRRGKKRRSDGLWVKVSAGKVVVSPSPKGAVLFGPFPSRASAREAADAVETALPSVFIDGGVPFAQMTKALPQLVESRPEFLLERLEERMDWHAEALRFEDAARIRARYETLARAIERRRIVRSLVGDREVSQLEMEELMIVWRHRQDPDSDSVGHDPRKATTTAYRIASAAETG